jgi:hypothetical protein
MRRIPAVIAAGAAAALLASIPATAQADESTFPTLIGDASLTLYASAVSPDEGSAPDPYIRMLPLRGSDGQKWRLSTDEAGFTTMVNLGTGGCLESTRFGIAPWVRQQPCTGDPSQQWELKWDDVGTIFVHAATGACLTQPGTFSPWPDDRLSVAPCDGGTLQTFGLVV